MSATGKARFRFGDKQDTSWMVDARCRDMPHEESLVIFFPEKGQNTRDAKKICLGDGRTPPCPVQGECLAYALSFEPDGVVGIFGGTTIQERRELHARIESETSPIARTYHNLENLEQLVELVRKVNRGR